MLIYFGYTFCPDVCPTALAVIAEALRALPPEEAARARGIFISVDPERDTPDVLKAYAPFFHPGIVGATGTPEQVAEGGPPLRRALHETEAPSTGARTRWTTPR